MPALCVPQFYKLTNSHTQISSYVFDVLRASVPKMNLDDVFLEKEAIAKSIKQVIHCLVSMVWSTLASVAASRGTALTPTGCPPLIMMHLHLLDHSLCCCIPSDLV